MKIKSFIGCFILLFVFQNSIPAGPPSSEPFVELMRPRWSFKDTLDLQMVDFLSAKVLFQAGDTVKNKKGKFVQAQGSHDATLFLPMQGSSNQGKLFVGHETKFHPQGKEGGGASTIFEVQLKNGQWGVIGDKHKTNYDPVGGTVNNCGATITPFGTLLTAEEFFPKSNGDIGQLSSEIMEQENEQKPYLNFGFMVEVDPATNQAIRKLKKMGRFVHEHAHVDSNNNTVYLTNDDKPAVFFKYVYSSKAEWTEGDLFAMKENQGKVSWVQLPKRATVLNNARDEAIKLGATLFLRHEWMTVVDGKMYITETGHDFIDLSPYLEMGGKPASYFKMNKQGGIQDPYGRILEFDIEQQTIRPFIEGGVIGNKDHFSNPDCITSFSRGKNNYLLVCEDIIARDNGRSKQVSVTLNDVFLIELIPGKSENKMKRIMTAAPGSEPTGACFTPDGKTLFINIQHPLKSNSSLNQSSTIAITGF